MTIGRNVMQAPLRKVFAVLLVGIEIAGLSMTDSRSQTKSNQD